MKSSIPQYDVRELDERAKEMRRIVVDISYRSRTSHIGCALSSVDILTALYFGVMAVDSENPRNSDRDRLILSKGHGVAALYAALAVRGFFPKEQLNNYCMDGSRLASHVVWGALPGTETSNGSGGHGLPMGLGMALALRNQGGGARVFVLAGDGETQEGSMWEAVLFAGHHALKNVTLIIDRNNLQDGTDGLRSNDILNLDPLDEKFKAFHWGVDEVDGHDIEQMIDVLRKEINRPHLVIARTIKGRGVSYMEDGGEWHGKCPSEEQYEIAMQELT